MIILTIEKTRIPSSPQAVAILLVILHLDESKTKYPVTIALIQK